MRLVAGAVVVAGLLALAVPGAASAHGRGSAIALDFRLLLDPVSPALPGLHVRVLDGDRALEARVDRGVDLLVRGTLREPMIRVDDRGVWANGASPTATADGVVSAGHSGWVQVGDGRSVAWHDHRLAPPPVTEPGPAGRFAIPVVLNGHPATIGGTFVRVSRPALWPWLLAAAAIVAGIVAAVRRMTRRGPVTIGLGVAAGVAALVAVTTFAIRSASSGGVAWVQLVSAFVVAIALAGLLVYLRGRSRVHAAAAVGVVAAAVSLSSLSVFWHGVVVSALPATGARLALMLALVCGAAAAVLSFLPEFDEASRGRA